MSTSLSTKVLSKYYICTCSIEKSRTTCPEISHHSYIRTTEISCHDFFSGHMTRTLPSFFKDAMSYKFATMGRNQKKPKILLLKHFIFFLQILWKSGCKVYLIFVAFSSHLKKKKHLKKNLIREVEL